MKLGSLFDGSGGFPLAARMCGIEPVWASEIEEYPIRVTKKNFPNMKHLGDITKINGAEIEPVDIISFGSPCQDLSVAGKRNGLDGNRSSLFFEAVRIIKEMRNATQGRYPTFILWENVTGAFSSNNGDDFWAVLNTIGGIAEDKFCVPRLEKWTYAGEILADGFSIAWRTLQADGWGVPQIRRRCFLIGCFRGQCAGEVLFKREGLSRDFKSCKCERENAAATIGTGVATTGDGQESVTPNMLFYNHGKSCDYAGPKDLSPTICAQMGTGGNNTPFVVHAYRKVSRAKSKDDATTWAEAKEANTLNTFDVGETRANELVVEDKNI